MQHSKKFALVPIDRMQQFEEKHLTDLDSQIHSILRRKSLDDHEKAKLYVQILQKYVSFPDVNAPKPSEETIPMSADENHVEEEKYTEKKISDYTKDIKTKILESVPIKHQKHALKIISFLEQNNLSWSKDKELIQNGIHIQGSNIVELINFLLRNRTKRPFAFEKFQEILNINKFPQDFVKNAYLSGVKTLYAKPKATLRRKLPAKTNWLKL